MFWAQLYKSLFARRRKRHLTIQDFYALDTEVQDDNIYDTDGVDIENGEIVGETAIITKTSTCNLPVALSLLGILSHHSL